MGGLKILRVCLVELQMWVLETFKVNALSEHYLPSWPDLLSFYTWSSGALRRKMNRGWVEVSQFLKGESKAKPTCLNMLEEF